MYQIDVASAAAALPAPAAAGTPGYFSPGNPGTGVAATSFPADMANMLMLEILNTVTAAGISPSKTTSTQLRDAIKILALLAYRAASFALDTGSVNAIVASPTVPATALVVGMEFSVRAANTNTGAVTLNWSGLGIKPVVGVGAPLVAGSIAAGSVYHFVYDGTSFELTSDYSVPAIAPASTSQVGIVALATPAETATGINTTKATTPADVALNVQAGTYNYAADTGPVNALAVALTPNPVALTTGIVVRVKVAVTNTGAVTLNVNGLGAKPVIFAGAALGAGGLAAGQVYSFAYDGASFQLQSLPSASASLGNPGYEISPNGKITQWGNNRTGVLAEGYGSFTFPFTFPTACDSLVVTTYNAAGNGQTNPANHNSYVQGGPKTNAGFQVYYQGSTGSDPSDGIDWIAIGH